LDDIDPAVGSTDAFSCTRVGAPIQGHSVVDSGHDPRVMERARRLLRMVDGKIQSDESK
jgi:predicted ABC-type transport system involved in lysophospholipase L1 biosynthesis ATPase subunit